MKNFVAIMEWDDSGRVAKYKDFDTMSEASAHVSKFIGRYPDAKALPKPHDAFTHWKRDAVAGDVRAEAPPEPAAKPELPTIEELDARLKALESK